MDSYSIWKNQQLEDKDLEDELERIQGDEQAIWDRFRCDLAFGTGGLRGLIGVGTNRINIYTVAKATQGLANYLNLNVKNKDISVAIAYDSRIKGELFTRKAASVLAANGITVYVYPELMPTPALSFAVRYLKCDAGICVTASHNPAEYNGYKVYGDDGCQIGPTFADRVLEEIGKTDIFSGVKSVDYDEALSDGRIKLISEEVFLSFISAVKGQSLLSDEIKKSNSLKIVYTPLNGAGRRSVMSVLQSEPCYEIFVVKEQEMPDGNFPTCPYPNPENPEALVLALELCEKTGADIMIATDPDCDRCRAAVKIRDGYRALSGNEIGILLMDYIAKRKKELGTKPLNPVAITTIVSTVMADSVAESHGIELCRVLTGFKYIGEQISVLEADGGQDRYLFGFEESCGYLSGGYVRDKDGVGASMLIAEMSLYYKSKGKTLFDVFEELCKEHGYYSEELLNFSFEGASGAQTMKNIINNLRENPPKTFGGSNVCEIIDYHKPGLREGEYNDITALPDSDVLEYRTEDGGKVIVRPSGTEPKLKSYLSAVAKTRKEADQKLKKQISDIGVLGLKQI